MSPTHAVKAGKRHRYCVSRPLVSGVRAEASGGLRIPAAEVARVVGARTQAWLADANAVLETSASLRMDTERQRTIIAQAGELAKAWPDLPEHQQRHLLGRLLRRVEVADEHITLHVVPTQLEPVAFGWRSGLNASDPSNVRHEETNTLSVAIRLQRIEKHGRLSVPAPGSSAPRLNDPLIRLLARAHAVQLVLLDGTNLGMKGVVSRTGLSRKHALALLRLSWLAPDITHAILRGQQPASLTADKLARLTQLPINWQAQKAALGFI